MHGGQRVSTGKICWAAVCCIRSDRPLYEYDAFSYSTVFIAEGTLSLGEIMDAAWKAFPRVMDRFTFAIHVEGISEGR